MGNSSGSSSGVGCLGILQIIFLVLKIAKVVTWSWWLVFAPTLLGLGLVVLALFLAIIATFVSKGF